QWAGRSRESGSRRLPLLRRLRPPPTSSNRSGESSCSSRFPRCERTTSAETQVMAATRRFQDTLFIALLACSLGRAPLSGQVGSALDGPMVDLNGGLGVGGQGIAALLGIRMGGSERGLIIRVAHAEEFEIFGPSPAESENDFALLYE